MKSTTLPIASVFLLFCFEFLTQAALAETLSLETYLDQVRKGHKGIQSSEQSIQASDFLKQEAQILYSPQLSANLSHMDDAKQQALFPYKKLIADTYTLGVSKQFSFGTQAKVSYVLNYFEYVGLKPPFYEGHPTLEVSQPLWRNFFGSETQKQFEIAESQTLAKKFGETFKEKLSLADAESTYWRLVLARENKRNQTQAFERSQVLYDWNKKRTQLHLADSSDLLQAEANLETKRLLLLTATHEERAAALAFNLARGIDSETVTEEFVTPDVQVLIDLKAPSKRGTRDDLKAAQESYRAASAGADLGYEKNRPSLDLFGSYGLNSRDSAMGTAFSSSLKTDQPTSVIGLKFSTPLYWGDTSDARKGYLLDKTASELQLERKAQEESQEWNDLTAKFGEAKLKLKLAQTLEDVQKKKLDRERDRLKVGRSVTYQVLVFEQDYSNAQIMRMEAQTGLLQIAARLKLFSDIQQGATQ